MRNDTLPGSKLVRRELIVFLGCFLGTSLLAIAGIVADKSPAVELITQLPGVLAVTCVVYMAVVVLRVIYLVISQFWFRK